MMHKTMFDTVLFSQNVFCQRKFSSLPFNKDPKAVVFEGTTYCLFTYNSPSFSMQHSTFLQSEVAILFICRATVIGASWGLTTKYTT